MEHNNTRADMEERRKREERWDAMRRQRSAEQYWYPNQEEFQDSDWNPARCYVAAARFWKFNEITPIPPMCFTDHTSSFNSARDSLQIASVKIDSIRGGLCWPLEVFGMVTARDVLDYRRRNIIYARPRSNPQTITEEHPYLVLTGPSRAVVTCHDPGNIEIALKVKGATESEDRDLSLLVLTLNNRGRFRSSHGQRHTSMRSTLNLGFHDIEHVVEATISVRITGGSSLLQGGFRGVFTASTASIDDVEVVLLDFRDGKLPVADGGTINLSQRVVSVHSVAYYRRDEKEDQLKVSIVAQSVEDEQNMTRHNIIFTPKTYGRSCGVLNVGACTMQVTVAWSEFDL